MMRDNRKKALVIGVNYRGSADELSGCENDAQAVAALLRSVLAYRDDEIVTMVEGSGEEGDAADAALSPTRAAIEAQMDALLASAVADARLREVFVSFSGHGTSLRDERDGDEDDGRDGDEDDGRDEAIVPLDYATAGNIRDDQIAGWLRRFPARCRIFCLFDACHSGTLGDLPAVYHHVSVPGRRRRVRRTKRVRVNGRWRWWRTYEWVESPATLVRREKWVGGATPAPDASVVTLSGCRDPQTSAELPLDLSGFDGGGDASAQWGGALTGAFVRVARAAHEDEQSLSCHALCQRVHETIRAATTLADQVPVICASVRLTPGHLFLRGTQDRARCCID